MSYGLAIQVYGHFYAGKMNMNMERKYKVYHDFAGEPFKIVDVSPFSIIGTKDTLLEKYIQSRQISTQTKADINKNFSGICKRANCDWFVLDNTSALLSLIQINDLHLISLSKVIIRSLGGFALTAAYISKIVEYVVWADPETCKIEWSRGGSVK